MAYFMNYYDSPLGRMVMAGHGDVLSALWFGDQDSFVFSHEADVGALPVFSETKRWLDLYFDGRVPDFMPPVEMEGTAFQRSVWQILRTIPYGETMTYGMIAGRIGEKTGRRMAAQAVGGAVGRNPISIIVPCHRVIGTDGSLTGYAGGLERKKWLLEWERGDMGAGRSLSEPGLSGNRC